MAAGKKPAKKSLNPMNRVDPECDRVLRMSKKEPAHSLPGETERIDLPSLVRRNEDIHYHLVERPTKAVNVSLTLRNWLIRHSSRTTNSKGKNVLLMETGYSKKLAKDLTSRGVSNCSRRQFYHYQDFYLAYPHIVGSLHPQLQDLFQRKGIIPKNDRGSSGT